MANARRILAVLRRPGGVLVAAAGLAVIGGVLLATGVLRPATGARAVNPSSPLVVSSRPVRLTAHHDIYWGAVITTSAGQAPWSMDAAATFERAAGKAVSIISWGSRFYSLADCGGYCGFQTAEFDVVRNHGAIPLFSWGPGWGKFTDSRIASGALDSYLTQWATAAREWGHPLFLRFAWEMNGSWFPWGVHADGNTAAAYVAMWRHVHDIFTRVGAKNVTWVWCPNVNARTTFQGISKLYPGDGYVDWTCLDGYNGDNPWLSFGQLYGPTYDQIISSIAPTKPLMLGEVASTEAGGSKARWITDMFTILPALFPRIRAIVWYESDTPGPGNHADWDITSTRSADASFRTGIRPATYTTNGYAQLDDTPIPAPRSAGG